MANKKTSDYAALPGGTVDPTWLADIAHAGVINYKGTFEEVRSFVNSGKAGGKTIEGGTAASENLILDSTSNATKGDVQIADGTTLHANTTNYETLVTDVNDIPNKKYVDDAVLVENIWDRTGTDVTLHNAGDTVQFDASGGIQFGAAGQNIVEFSTDGTFAADVDTKLVTEKAIKTYVDGHSSNNIWTRTGTDVTLTNAGDTIQFDAAGGIQFGAAGQNIVEFSIDGTFAADVDTKIPTEKAVKTYVDAHTANGMWDRTGTLISVSNAGDTLDFSTANGTFLSESGTLNIAAGTGITVVNDDIQYIQSATAGNTTITANPQIVTPTKAKRAIFIGRDNTKTVTFVNGNGLATDNGQPFTVGLNDMIVFVYSTVNSIWVEETRKDNS